MLLIKLVDGSIAKITELQHAELIKKGSVYVCKNNKGSIDYFKDKIIKYFHNKNESISINSMFNKFRINRQEFEIAVDQLCDDGLIFITEYHDKYQSNPTKVINLTKHNNTV